MCGMATAGPVTIKNIDPSVTREISRQEVYWMYTMRNRFWDNGRKIIVYYQDFNSQEHKDFVTNVLLSTPTKFSTSVDVYVNGGNAGYFRKVNGPEDLKTEIAKTPGAIGYLNSKYILLNKGDKVEKLIISN